jgi:beta-galactosidase
MVERDLTPKESYFVFQSYWSSKPMVHIYGHTWTMRFGKEGGTSLVKVYANCPQVELELNGQSCGIKTRNARDFPANGLHWELKFPHGKNHLVARAIRDGKTVEDRIEFSYQTRRWGAPKKFKIKVRKISGGRRYVAVQAVDKNGILCADAGMFVRFGITGAGVLLDNLGTSRNSRYRQLANGQAGICVQAQGGVSVVSVMAKGMRTCFAKIR